MGTTPGGLPYPEPTDPVAEGADAIKALATGVDTRPMGRGALSAAGTLFPGAYYPVGVESALSPETRGGVTFTPATGVFTVPRAGLYRVLWGVSFAPLASPGSVRGARIDNAAGTPAALASVFGAPPPGQPHTLSGARLLRLAAAATLRLTAYHDAAVTVNVQPVDTYFSIEWAGV